jgi:bacteriorhodopsin
MTAKRRWADLSAGQRGAIGGAAVVQVALLVAALLDLRRRPARKVRGDKRLWAAASFVNYIGPLAYFAYGRRR